LIPLPAAARAADLARVAAETAAAEAAGVGVQFVFVERTGSAPAAAAVVAALGAIETQIGGRLERVAKLARTEASTALPVDNIGRKKNRKNTSGGRFKDGLFVLHEATTPLEHL
jgi:hypothetical protein